MRIGHSPCCGSAAWLIVLVLGLASHCTSQSLADQATSNDTICISPPYTPFPVLIPAPEPVCLLEDAPAFNGSDEFLSFEEWKSRKFEESPIPAYDKATNPNPNDPSSLLSPDLTTDITSSTSDGAIPLPSLRVPLTDRFNYASSECSARIQSIHKSIKSPWAILTPKRDKYMLSPCSTRDKFVVVELCDDIQIDTIQLANFEFFSGVFKDINISGSQTYDADNWHVLGTFRAKNVRTVQSFLLPRDSRFFRYVKIDFLSHYGSEYYCPVSLLRVYGLTQIEEYKWEEWQTAWRREHEARGLRFLASEAAYVAASVEAVQYAESSPVPEAPSPTSVSAAETQQISTSTEMAETLLTTFAESSTVSPSETVTPTPSTSSTAPPTPPIEDVETIVDHIMRYDDTSSQSKDPEGQPSTNYTASPTSISTLSGTADHNPAAPNPPVATPSAASESDAIPTSEAASATPVIPSKAPEGSESAATTTLGMSTDIDLAQLNATATVATPQVTTTPLSTSTSTRPKVVTVSSHSRPIISPSPGPGSVGSESIYRTIMNRLTVLESNSSLAVRYVEDQTRHVREALKRLEKDVGRLESLSNQQQALYRRVVIELQQHKRETETERAALLLRLDALSDEVTLEKRLGLAQLCLLLIVLVFMAFTRSASLGTSFLDSVSTSNKMIGRARKTSGLWRSKRTNSEPERPKLPPELLSDPLKSRPSPPSTDASRPRPLAPQTPAALTTPAASRPSVDMASPTPPALATPFVLRTRSPEPIQNATRPLPEVLPQRQQAHSHPNLTPSHPSASSSRDTPFVPGSARRALAKTAHLHEVGRRRRVSGSNGKPGGMVSSSSSVPPSPPLRPTLPVTSSDEHLDEVRDVLRTTLGGTPSGTPRRPRSRPRSRGSLGSQRALHSPNPISSTQFPRSPPRVTDGGNRRRVNDASGNLSGSDVWEDTSDPDDNDLDDHDALADAFFNPERRARARNRTLRDAENMPPPSLSPSRLRRLPSEVGVEPLRTWSTTSPDASSSGVHSLGSPHKHSSPITVGLQS